jgi:hypothetical protein
MTTERWACSDLGRAIRGRAKLLETYGPPIAPSVDTAAARHIELTDHIDSASNPGHESRRGAKVVRFRWTPAASQGRATTGFKSSGFPTEARGIAAAQRHAMFSNVKY